MVDVVLFDFSVKHQNEKLIMLDLLTAISACSKRFKIVLVTAAALLLW